MQLHDLRSHPVIKWFAYAGFAFIIISFVFFYGWNSAMRRHEDYAQSFGKVRADGALSFLPWRKWEMIGPDDVKNARGAVRQKKMSLLGPQLEQMLNQQGFNSEQLVSDSEAIEQAANIRLLDREADRRGIEVSQAETIDMLKQNRNMDARTFEMILKQQGLTADQFIAKLRETQKASRAQEAIAQDAHISLYDLWQEYLLVNEKLKLRMIAYPLDKFETKAEATQAELEEELQKNPDKYRVDAKRTYRYVKLSKDELRKKIQPTEPQIQAYYEQNPKKFERPQAAFIEDAFAPVGDDQSTTVAQMLITRFADRATTGSKLNALVDEIQTENPTGRIYFQDKRWIERTPQSIASNGPEFVSRALTMADNTLSTPVLSPRGRHVIHKLEGRAAGVKALTEVAEEAKKAYIESKTDEEFKAQTAKLRESIKRFSNIRDFAQEAALEDKQSTATLASSSFIPEIGSLADNAGYIRSLKVNQLSELIPGPDFVCALQVAEEMPSYLPKVEEVREKLEKEIKHRKAKELAEKAAKAALEQVRTGETFETVVKDAPTTIVLTKAFTRLDPVEGLGSPLINFIQQTTRVAKGSSGLTPYGFTEDDPQGYALWQVVDVESPTRKKFQEDRRSFERQYLQVLQLTFIEEWLADMRRKAEFTPLGRGAS